MTILDKLKKYFETTQRKQVLKDWEETKENTKNVNSPTVEQFLLYNVGNCADKELTQCMIGRDAECNHPKCPISEEDMKNGKYCTLPLYDYRQ